jgi:ribosomal protein S27E
MPDDDKIRFQCPHCEKGLNVSAAHAGKQAKCPGCGKPATVPECHGVHDLRQRDA